MPVPTQGNNTNNDVENGSNGICNSLVMGYSIRPVTPTQFFSGIRVDADSDWNTVRSASVKDNDQWKSVKDAYIKEGNEWKQTGFVLKQEDDRSIVKFNLCGGFEVAGDFGGYSYMEYYTPNQMYVPAGWMIRSLRFSARYDVICDGIFLGQTAQFAASLNQTKRKGLILCRRSGASYVGSASTNVGNVSSGVQPSAFTWETPSWAVTNMTNSNGGNMQAVHMFTPDVNDANMCGGVSSGPTTKARLSIPSSYRLPFPVDCIISIRYSNNCGGYRRFCNHYVCDNSSYLEFEEP